MNLHGWIPVFTGMTVNDMKNNNKNWFEKGLPHVWHPYTQMKTMALPAKVKSAEGSHMILEDGTKILDGIASWWSVCHGYQHPHIIKKMQAQLNELSHVMFAGTAHEPAYELSKKIAAITPEGLTRVFFADSGSVAVEIAMKMAVQYWHNQGNKRKNKFICFKNGYHGDTMGALSLNDPEGWISKSFNHYAPQQFCVELPLDEYGFAEFEEILNGVKKDVAGIIIEPLVQGAGGFTFYSADILAEIHKLAKRHGLIFIADEIMTGLYRTGNIFACNEAGIVPDIMCIGKALTGGMISLGAVVTNDEIYNAFLDDSLDKAFLHGPTFMANPLACSAAIASLELFEHENYLEKVEKIENWLNKKLSQFRVNEKVKEVRVKGAIGVVELKPFSNDDEMWEHMFALRKKYLKHKVWLRPFKNVIYILPSFNITESEIDQLVNAIKAEL